MFENRKCLGQMIGGAAVGLAVGMAIQKMLSPRSPKYSAMAVKASPVACGCGKKRSTKKNFQIPSNREKNRDHHRSKSACERSKSSREKNSNLHVSKSSLDKLELGTCYEKLRSKSENRKSISKSREKIGKMEKSGKIIKDSPFEWRNSCESLLNASSEYLESKDRQDSIPLLFDINNRKSRRHFDFSNDHSSDKVTNNFDSIKLNYNEFPSTLSTEYLPVVMNKNSKKCERKISLKTNRYIDFSIDSLDDSDKTIYHVIAKCGTTMEKWKMNNLNDSMFVTLPNFYGSEISSRFDEK